MLRPADMSLNGRAQGPGKCALKASRIGGIGQSKMNRILPACVVSPHITKSRIAFVGTDKIEDGFGLVGGSSGIFYRN